MFQRGIWETTLTYSIFENEKKTSRDTDETRRGSVTVKHVHSGEVNQDTTFIRVNFELSLAYVATETPICRDQHSQCGDSSSAKDRLDPIWQIIASACALYEAINNNILLFGAQGELPAPLFCYLFRRILKKAISNHYSNTPLLGF